MSFYIQPPMTKVGNVWFVVLLFAVQLPSFIIFIRWKMPQLPKEARADILAEQFEAEVLQRVGKAEIAQQV